MSDPAAPKNWQTEHRRTYLTSGGAQGHIMDLGAVGGYPFTTHCLIRYKGRKSGKTRITPLIYGDYGGEIVIVASKGGADQHPHWYCNLIEEPVLDVQIATQAFRVSWRVPTGDERSKVWSYMAGVFPPYDKYQQATAREIPLVMIKTLEPIDVFTLPA